MSVIAAAVKHMLAAGMAHDAIVAAVEAMEAEMPAVKSSGAARMARYRERHKASQTSQSVTSDDPLISPMVSPTPLSLTPLLSPKESPPIGGPKKAPKNSDTETPPPKRRTSIRADWTPSQANLDYARSKNLTDQEIANAADQFRNHHLAKGTVFASWDAGWRTWVGNFRRFSGGAMAGRTQTGGSGQAVSLASIAARNRFEMLL
jgi:hypothetical protein